MSVPPVVILLVLAVFLQVALTIIVLLRTGSVRFAHVKAGRVKIRDIALGQDAWPEDATKLANSYRSQFELPVLFYVNTLIALALQRVDLGLAGLALAFVATRIWHCLVHTGSNDVSRRFYVFATGLAILSVMWVWLLIKLIFGV